MARKRKSATEDLFDLVALMPWWAALLLGLVGYIVLDRLSTLPPGAAAPGQVAGFVQRSMIAAFASAGKIVIPSICVVAAFVSFTRRHQRQALVADASARGAEAIARMSWREFEAFVSEVFRHQGYSVVENFDGGADGGVDLVLKKNGQRTLVQCKHWKNRPVGVTVVRELLGVMTARQAQSGVVVTSGVFTEEAVRFSESCNVSLWDGMALSTQLRQGGLKSPAPDKSALVRSPQSPREVACPQCGAAMVKRTAKAGFHAGQQFWGCSRYPKCRGTREATTSDTSL